MSIKSFLKCQGKHKRLKWAGLKNYECTWCTMKVHVGKVTFLKAKKKKCSQGPENHSWAMWTRHTWKCRLPGPLTLSESWIFCYQFYKWNFCSGWRHEWEDSCVPQIMAFCPMRPFSGWQHTHLQRFDKTLYSLRSIPWLSCDKAWGTRSSLGVITSGINGQELLARKISFRKLPDGSVGGWQHQVSVQNEPFCPPGGQVWAASGWGFWGWRGWHGWPLGGLHVLKSKDSLIHILKQACKTFFIYLCSYEEMGRTKTELESQTFSWEQLWNAI